MIHRHSDKTLTDDELMKDVNEQCDKITDQYIVAIQNQVSRGDKPMSVHETIDQILYVLERRHDIMLQMQRGVN